MRSNQTVRFFRKYVYDLPYLTFKERAVLVKRLSNITLINLGIRFKLTEGRIRQIEKGAIKKLKSTNWQMSLFKKVK